jgi:hypothetical protein
MYDSEKEMQRFEKAFAQVVEIYAALVSVDGQIKQQEFGKRDTCGDNPRGVKPSDQDFIADVELAFDRALPTPQDKQILVDMLQGKEVPAEYQQKVRQRVGRELVRRQIHPANIYFRGREVKRGT